MGATGPSASKSIPNARNRLPCLAYRYRHGLNAVCQKHDVSRDCGSKYRTDGYSGEEVYELEEARVGLDTFDKTFTTDGKLKKEHKKRKAGNNQAWVNRLVQTINQLPPEEVLEEREKLRTRVEIR